MTSTLKRSIRPLAALGLAALALAAAAPAAAQDQIAVRGARIYTVAGDTIENGTILIEGGKITAVGTDLRIPTRARVIDAAGKVVIPGIVDVHSSSGMDAANEDNPEVPYVTVLDAIDPNHQFFKESLRNGVTTIAVIPGNNTMISGQGAIVKPGEAMVDDMVLVRSAGLKISLRPTGARSRMSQLSAIRDSLTDAKDAMEDEEDPAPNQNPQLQLRRAALARLLNQELTAFIYCERAMDVRPAIDLTEDFGLRTILVLGRDGYKAADLIAESGLPVVLDAQLVFWEYDARTDEDTLITVPRFFHEAGVKPVFQVTGGAATGSLIGANFHWYQAATNVKYGAPASEALESITLRAARALGVEEFVGSIEPGKEADLVILSGEPFDLNTWVETVLVNGQVAYERANDRTIQNLLNPNKVDGAGDGLEN